MNKKTSLFSNLPWFLQIHFVGLVLISGLLLLAITLGVAWMTRQAASPELAATAVINIISAPTATQPIPSPTAVALEGVDEQPSALSAGVGIVLDAYVQIVGTGGDGLRLRDKAGLAGTMRLLGSEAEIFVVKDGPVEADGYTWWYLVGPYDDSRFGWAAANYLSLVQNP